LIRLGTRYLLIAAKVHLRAYIVDSDIDSPCLRLSRSNYTCSACIQLHNTCAWCSSKVYEFSRCGTAAYLRTMNCSEIDISDPKVTLKEEKNAKLTNAGEKESEDEAVQLKPQELTINIRPKAKVEFDVTYRQAVDYPVDLYYLMDLSYSMTDDKANLAKLGDALGERMKNITKNFRLGFGSFIDKSLKPFVDPRAQHPCPDGCVPPYGFKHQMTLTREADRFSKEVLAAEISGNLDAPEGGFDAIVQTLACHKEIGWRNRARKMIVFSTDAGFHYAGDGRLAGVVMPNDGKCHLDKDGYYTKSSEQDYPSIALLHQKILERKANLIFAVTSANQKLYSQLKEALPDVGSSVGVLANDSKNIIELIATEYNKISQEIIMVDNANASQGLHLSYKTKCLGVGSIVKNNFQTNICNGIKVGDEVTFKLTLEVTHCVDQRDFVLKIGPSGLDEVLIVNVHVQCDCDCENKNIVRNAKECNGKGDLVCGVCKCHGTNIGRFCECDRLGFSDVALEAACRKDKNSPICEGRGYCECGVCKCKTRENALEKITGKYCECDNYNCPHHNRKPCAGHGVCECNKCICDENWTGSACQCLNSTENCRSANGKICNGHGQCICGQCLCNTTETHRYSGAKCESCPTCPKKCVELKSCVQCQQWKTGPLNETMCEQCPFSVIPVDTLPVINDTEKCQFEDTSDDCTFYFLYFEDEDGNVTVWVKKEKDCPPPVPVLAIVLGVIAGIVILGLLLLLVWKALTVIHDRREVAKFEDERLMAKWDTNENPIYKQATTTFKNPVYNGSSVKSRRQ
uniref:Integrin beta n=1 Tax=Syphacia muris TaxID=451379 RepID=A0A0N5AQW1_9BILA